MINWRLVPATLATQGKYIISGLRVSKVEKNQVGDIKNAPIDNLSSQYPLVSGTDLFGKNLIVPVTIKGKTDTMYFPEAVVNISRDRNIVATPVLNGNGTVKEMITDNDLSISISLAVVSTSDDGNYDENVNSFCDTYPYLGVKRLRKLLDEPNRLDIVSDFLELFDLNGGDFGIVVKSYTVNQDTHLNRQVFDIQALSDYDYNLLIEE